MIFKIINGKAVRYDSGGGITKIDDISVDFSQAESRENIAPTDTMKIILGKIMKWFSDLSAGAASSLLGQNLTAGKVLVSDDGGKVAASVVDASKVGFLNGVTGDLQEQINSLNSAIETVNSVIVGKGRYTVNANQEISFQIYDNSVYLISTLMSVYTSRSLAVVFGGNGNQVNAGQKASIIQLVTASGIAYSVSEETGKFNQITVKNNSVYNIVVLIVDLSGRNYVRL